MIISSTFITGMYCTLLSRSRPLIGKTLLYTWRLANVLLTELYPQMPASWPLRFVIGGWLVFTMIFISAFAGVILSFMTKATEYKELNSLEDLCDELTRNKDLRVEALSLSPISQFMETS